MKSNPKVVLDMHDRYLVSIPSSTEDFIWSCMRNNSKDYAFLSSLADGYISSNGKSGRIIDAIESGRIPCFLTHWTSLFANGRETGLIVLEIVLKRIKEYLADKVEFVSFDTLMQMLINDYKKQTT